MLDHIYYLSYILHMKIEPNTFFTALANEIRLRCLLLIQIEGELCVCELMHGLDLSQPMVSRHLALLRDSGLVIDRREGQWIYYSINPKLDDYAQSILQTTAQANSHQAPFSSDFKTLNSMPNRPNSICCA